MKMMLILWSALISATTAANSATATGREGAYQSDFLDLANYSESSGPTTSAISWKSVESEEYIRVATAMTILYPEGMPCPERSMRLCIRDIAIQHLKKCQLDDYYRVIDAIRAEFGNRYDSLGSLDKILFSVARSVEVFFKGDMINASAFLLEARQINCVQRLKLNFDPLAAALYDIRFAIDKRSGEPLTEEQKNERLFFRLHLSKLLDRTHVANTSQNPLVFLKLATMDRQDRVAVKLRNRKLYAHSVYLMAQYTAGQICRNQRIDILGDVFPRIIENFNFFEGQNSYREEGQRLYLCLIGTVIPQLFDRFFACLKELVDKGSTSLNLMCAYKPDSLIRIIDHLVSRQKPLPEKCLSTITRIARNIQIPILQERLSTLKARNDQELLLAELRSVGVGIFDDQFPD